MRQSGNTSAQARFWDNLPTEKRFSHPLRREWLRRHTERPARVLDLGCGYGRTLGELHREGCESLIGVDVSFGMLRRCRAALPVAHLVQSDGRAVPLQDGCVDLAVLFAVLTSTPRNEDQIALLGEITRVLRPRGLLYLSDFLLNDDERNRERYHRYQGDAGPYGTFELADGMLMRHHRVEWLLELTGLFERLESETFQVITMNGNRSAAFQFLGRWPGEHAR